MICISQFDNKTCTYAKYPYVGYENVYNFPSGIGMHICMHRDASAFTIPVDSPLPCGTI